MSTITKKQVEQLAQFQNNLCISIYFPTHQFGDEVKQGLDRTVLKNKIRQIDNELEEKGISKSDIDQLTKPIQKLYDDTNFWSHQTDGLAIFVSNGFFETYHLPRTVREIHSISDRFHLVPMITQLEPAGNYFVLTLDLKNIALYRVSKSEIHNVTDEVKDLPVRIEDVVGEDHEQHIQFRTQQAGVGQAMFHGQGGGKDDRRQEILQFFRSVNEQLIPVLRTEDIPLMLFGQEYLFSIYQEANEYKRLLDKQVAIHAGGLNEEEIHQKSWELMRPVLLKTKEEKISDFKRLHGTGTTATDIKAVLLSAVEGRVDTLFVPREDDLYGTYNAKENTVTVDDSADSTKPSLINLAVIHTFLNGGNIYSMDRVELPDNKSRVNALLRY